MIDRFDGTEHRFLSNFWMSSVEYEGIIYPSSEHAYQAAKFFPVKTRQKIATLKTPGEAKRFGRRNPMRDDWEDVKVEEMYKILLTKFGNKELRQLLLATGDQELIEGNTWGDKFWGQCPVGDGENWLGKLLMKVRREIK